MKDSIKLSKLLSVYPDIEEENFSGRIASLNEFHQLAQETETKRGDLFPPQKIIKLFLSKVTPYDTLLVIWPPGRGKTRASLEVALSFLDYPQKFGDPTNNQKILIITKRSVTVVWKDQMKAMPEYSKDSFDKAPATVTSGKKMLTMMVKKYADVFPLDGFANELERLNDDDIRSRYSRPLIIIDEAHFLKTTVETRYTEDGQVDTSDASNKKAYLQVRRLMDLAVGSMKLILTGTPMADKPEELVSVTSLFLPKHKQMTIEAFNAAYAEGEQALMHYLEPRLRGYISYVREDRGNVRFWKQGEPFEYTDDDGHKERIKLKIVDIRMSKRQSDYYRRFVQEDEESGDLSDQTFYINRRKVLNNIFLDPRNPMNDGIEMEYIEGKKDDGFVVIDPPLHKTAAEEKAAERKKEATKLNESVTGGDGGKIDPTKRKKNKHILRTFKFKYLQDYTKMVVTMPDGSKKRIEPDKVLKFGDPLPPVRMELVRQMSAKAYFVIKTVYEDVTYPGEGEVSFVFHPFIRSGGGIPLGMFFEFVGFTRFTGDEPEIKSPASFPDMPRFAYLAGTPASTDAQISAIRGLSNSPENMYGRKVLVLIASEIAATGLSFFNVRKFIHLGPNFKLYRQARGRTVRLDSHLVFTPEKRYVKTYLLAASLDDGTPTVDHKAWARVYEKEHNIKMPLRIAKRISIDCMLNSKRNEKADTPESLGLGCIGGSVDVDGNRLTPLKRNYDTYHLHWAEKEFDEIDLKIRRLFRVTYSMNLATIVQALPEHHSETIIWGLSRMLSRQELMIDRFGNTRILREKDGIYFLDNNLALPSGDFKASLSSETYDNTLCQYTQTTFVEAPENFNQLKQKNYKKKTTDVLHNLDTFMEQWNNLDSEVRLVYLERALLNKDIDEEVRQVILKDLAPVHRILDGCIHHHYDAIRTRHAKGNYQANNVELNEKNALVRVCCKGEKDFKPLEGGKLQKYLKLYNTESAKKFEEVRKKYEEKGIPFVMIYNSGSDGGLRLLNVQGIRIKKDGTVHKGTVRGRKNEFPAHHEMVIYALLLDVKNPIEPISWPRNINELRQIVQNFLTGQFDAGAFNEETLRFIYSWIPARLPALTNFSFEEEFGLDYAWEMSRFFEPTDFTYETMLRRRMFVELRRLDMVIIR